MSESLPDKGHQREHQAREVTQATWLSQCQNQGFDLSLDLQIGDFQPMQSPPAQFLSDLVRGAPGSLSSIQLLQSTARQATPSPTLLLTRVTPCLSLLSIQASESRHNYCLCVFIVTRTPRYTIRFFFFVVGRTLHSDGYLGPSSGTSNTPRQRMGKCARVHGFSLKK